MNRLRLLPYLVTLALAALAGCSSGTGADVEAPDAAADAISDVAPDLPGDADLSPDPAPDLSPEPLPEADAAEPAPEAVEPADALETADVPAEADAVEACPRAVPPPVPFEILQGFESWEDFAFDDLGNAVGIDGSGNLVRISKDGQKKLFFPGIGDTAGVGFLPGGDLVVNVVSTGSLVRVSPNGGSGVVLSGLDPNDLVIVAGLANPMVRPGAVVAPTDGAIAPLAN